MEKIVILGGGVAGLSCLNALLDRGISTLLIEGGRIGTPKICGEFLAPPVVEQLQRWEIGPIQNIQQVHFYTQQKKFALNFPREAGAMARSEVELQLAKRARTLQGRILENTRIDKIIPATEVTPHIFKLIDGHEITAQTAIIATGRLNQHSQNFKYRAIKFHWPEIREAETLLMYSAQNAYAGLIPITNNMSNCACLANDKIDSTHALLQRIFPAIDLATTTMLEGCAPKFGRKKNPHWPHTYWIGDALASFPPAIGFGFAHSILSAIHAADFYQQNKFLAYQKSSLQIIQTQLWLSQAWHYLLMRPHLGLPILSLLSHHQNMSRFFLRKLGYST